MNLNLYRLISSDNNIDLFFKEHFATIPDQFTSKIDCNNIISVCDILWINNLRSWRDKPNLEAIQFKHILNFDLFSAAIEKICQFYIDDLHTIIYFASVCKSWRSFIIGSKLLLSDEVLYDFANMNIVWPIKNMVDTIEISSENKLRVSFESIFADMMFVYKKTFNNQILLLLVLV